MRDRADVRRPAVADAWVDVNLPVHPTASDALLTEPLPAPVPAAAAPAGPRSTEDEAVGFFFAETRTCEICRKNKVEHASYPCGCNAVCKRCYDTEAPGSKLPCPVCLKEVRAVASPPPHTHTPRVNACSVA